jgi:hypothetical protein
MNLTYIKESFINGSDFFKNIKKSNLRKFAFYPSF